MRDHDKMPCMKVYETPYFGCTVEDCVDIMIYFITMKSPQPVDYIHCQLYPSVQDNKKSELYHGETYHTIIHTYFEKNYLKHQSLLPVLKGPRRVLQHNSGILYMLY